MDTLRIGSTVDVFSPLKGKAAVFNLCIYELKYGVRHIWSKFYFKEKGWFHPVMLIWFYSVWCEGKADPVTGREGYWLWDVEAPTFSLQSAHRWRWGCQPHACMTWINFITSACILWYINFSSVNFILSYILNFNIYFARELPVLDLLCRYMKTIISICTLIQYLTFWTTII
jgi:hypothetical protein